MDNYSLKWPTDFDDYSWELESKGWFTGVQVIIGEKVFTPVFYDPVRLAQDIDAEVSAQKFFSAVNLIVLDRVSRESIESVLSNIAEKGNLVHFFTDNNN